MSGQYRTAAAAPDHDCEAEPDDRKPFGYGRDECPSCGQWWPALHVEHEPPSPCAPPLFKHSRPASLRVRHAYMPFRSECGAVWYTKLAAERTPTPPSVVMLWVRSAFETALALLVWTAAVSMIIGMLHFLRFMWNIEVLP